MTPIKPYTKWCMYDPTSGLDFRTLADSLQESVEKLNELCVLPHQDFEYAKRVYGIKPVKVEIKLKGRQ